jgi:arginase
MGPFAIRYAGLEHGLLQMGLRVCDYHNIAVSGPESAEVGNPRAKFDDLIEEACCELRVRVAEIARADHFPLVLGGDHSIAMGTVAGLFDAWGEVGVLWIDAHGDINTPETTPSGNVHGMPVATLLGKSGLGARLGWDQRSLRPDQVVLFGTRTLDAGERRTIRELGVRAFTMSELDQRGVKACLDEAVERLGRSRGIHISFDIDAVDPLEAPGVGTPWPGSPTNLTLH